jgi:hypothetical protein
MHPLSPHFVPIYIFVYKILFLSIFSTFLPPFDTRTTLSLPIMKLQSILLTLVTLTSTALAGCGDLYGRDVAKCEANCPGTCFNRGGTAVLLMQCGC